MSDGAAAWAILGAMAGIAVTLSALTTFGIYTVAALLEMLP